MRFPKRVPVIISKKYVFAFFSFFLSLHTTLLTFVWLTVVLDLFCISFDNAASLYLTQFGLITYKQPSCKTVFLLFLKCYEHTTFKLCKTIQIIQPNFNATNNSDFMQTDGKKGQKGDSLFLLLHFKTSLFLFHIKHHHYYYYYLNSLFIKIVPRLNYILTKKIVWILRFFW